MCALFLAVLAFAYPSAAAAQVAPECDTSANSEILRTGKPITLSVNCSDADGDPVTVSHGTADHGTLGAFVRNPDTGAFDVTYTPTGSYTGPDDFTFTAHAGSLSSPTFGFDLIITENHAPQCDTNGTFHAKVGETIQVSFFCSDQDTQDQHLTYTPIAGPAHGTLANQQDFQVDYTPTGGYTGEDAFTLRASDDDLADTYSQRLHVADTPLCSTPTPIQVRSGNSRDLTVDCTWPDDDFGPQRYEIVTQPAQGTLAPSNPRVSPERTYTANAGATGSDSFTTRATGASGASPAVTQAITTGPGINSAPACTADPSSPQVVYADRPQLLFPSCTDADDDALTFTAGAAPAHGTSATSDDGVVYTANPNYMGEDSVPFIASDGHGGSTGGEVPVNVNAPEPPTCFQGPIDVTVRPGRSVDLQLFCESPQGDPQSYAHSALSKGSLGTFDDSGAVTYTADAGASGTDTFTLTASNVAGDSEPQTVTVAIDASFNRAPECNDNTFSPKRVVKDATSTLDLGAVCRDPDGDAMEFVRQGSPAHGTASSGPAATLTYTPTGGYTGPDAFAFIARDDRGAESAAATEHLTVVTSLAPTCTPHALITLRPSQAKSIGFNCTDPDSQTITYKIVAPPNGTLSPSGDSLSAIRTYTAPASAGPDSFTYRATSSGGQSGVYTQQFTVDPNTNAQPACGSNAGEPEDTVQGRPRTMPIGTWCADDDGDALTFTRAAPDPQHGTATASNGVITYTSAPGYSGPDSFGYVASDGHGGSTANTFSVNVVAPVAPTCNTPAAASVRPSRSMFLSLDCADAFGDPLTFQVTDAPDLGTLDPAGDGPEQARSYTAGATEGDDAYSFRATNDNGTSNTATQVVHVDAAANSAPDCVTNSGFPEPVASGATETLEPFCDDEDQDALSYTKLSDPAHGTLNDAGGTLVYTAAPGFTGPDQFNYKASDGHGGESAPTTHHVDVAAPQPPTCASSAPVVLRPHGVHTFAFDCSDASGGELGYVIDSAPAIGTLSGTGPGRSFTAGAEEGDATFTWHAHGDASGDSATQTQVVTVDATQNTAPVCPASISLAAEAGVQQTVSPACTDGDGDPLTFAKASEPQHGTLTDSGGVLRYTASSGYVGADSFTYRASDGHAGQSGVSTVQLDVTHTNHAPVCDPGPYAFSVEADTVLTLPAPPCTDSDGDTITYEIPTPPAHGTLGDPQLDGTRTYTPDPGYEGADGFELRAFDGAARSAPQTVQITVTPSTNQAPTCSPVSRTVAPAAAATIQLACSDPDNDPVTLSVVDAPAHGALGALDQGTDQVTYTPADGYFGADSFTYRATDGRATGPAATVTLDVTHAPACDDVSQSTAAGVAVSVPLSCTDADGDALTLSVVDGPAHGGVSPVAGGAVTYTPDDGFFGADSFTYNASDGAADSVAATVSLTVTRAPNCDDVALKTAVDQAISVPLSCDDDDGDPLSLSIAGGPAHGTLGPISGNSVTYTPDAGAFGPDSFTYTASDGVAESEPATVSIVVTRAPSCDDVSRRTAVGAAVSVPLTCTDPDGDALTLSTVDDPSHGVLGAVSGGAVTYTPDDGYFGADSFTYGASDGVADSTPATVSISVTRAPACDDVSRSTAAGVAVSVPLSCTDPEGDPLTLSIADPPSTGSLGAISSGSVTYTPDADAFGTDTFTYTASDGTAGSAPATVTITISRPPACDDASVRTAVDEAVSVPLTCTDPDGDPLALSIGDGPSNGSLGAISGNSVTYTPDAGSFGADSFTYLANDGVADSAPATVDVEISRPPSCDDVSLAARAGVPVTVALSCSDADGDPLTLSAVDGPSKGSLGSISGNEVTYTPDADATGLDTFTYRASDGVGESAPATVTVSISHAPACDDVARRTAVGTAVTVPLSCSDADGDALALAIADGPSKGSLGPISGNEVTYTPDNGAFGVDTFTYQASDSLGDGPPATVSITITRPPSCDDVSLRTAVDDAIDVPLACSDPDSGDTLTLSKVTDPSKGSLGPISGTSVTYTPDAGAFGSDSFTYKASDGVAESAPATVDIEISRPPSCDDASVTARTGAAVTAPLSCTDPEGDALTLSAVDGPTEGTLGSMSGNSVSYTPDADAAGSDSFTYRASDGVGESAPATVTITISHAATCDDVVLRTAIDTPVTVPLSCSDAEGDPLTLSIGDGPSKGSLGAIAGGEVTYTPDAGAFGADSFTYKADDGAGDGPPATVSLTITRPPSCDDVSVRTAVDDAVDVPLACTDPDGDPLTLSVADAPAHGSLGPMADDAVTYTPEDGYFGADAFTYRASDGTAESAPATVDVEISRPPTCDAISLTARAGTAVTIPLTCSDPEGDALTLSTVEAPSEGSLGNVSGGSVTYTPDVDAAGSDSFTYKASDGVGESAPAIVTIAITHAPACQDVAPRTAVDTPVTVPLSCSDADGDALTLAIEDGPSKGSLGAISGDEVTYTPDGGAFGADSFTYRADDGQGDGAPATVSITITRPPACDDVSVRTAVDDAVDVPLACTDPDGDSLTLSVVDGPSKGSLGAISGNSVTYTPDNGEFGADSFTYEASDGTAQSPPATVDVEISRPPACDAVSLTARVGTPVAIPLTCSDPEGDALTLSAVDAPSQGSLGTFSENSVTYTPDVDADGQDSFTYKASDGVGESAPAAVTIAITHAPRCAAVTAHTRVETPVTVPLSCSDADGDPLTLAADSPSKGSLGAISGNAVTYTPDAGAFGADTFTYTADDGTSTSAPTTATITISRAPACSDLDRTTAVGQPVTVPLTCTDPDGDALTLSINSGPSKGSLGGIADGKVTYTPDHGEYGADSFSYRADDGDGTSQFATVSITITRPPACDPVTTDTPAGQAVAVDLACADPDGDPITLEKVTGPSHGSLGSIDQDAGQVTYTPTAHYSGPDTFTYRATDGTAVSAPATVSITVTNTAPTCEPVSKTVPAGAATEVQLSCADAEDDALTLSVVDGPSHGSLGSIAGGKVTYTPEAGYFGDDSFTYRASDGNLQSSAATVSLAVVARPTVSLAVDHASAVEGSTLAFTATAADPDGGAIGEYRYTVDGSVVQTSASKMLSRRFDAAGSHMVTVRATDNDGQTATATKTVQISRKPGGGTPPPSGATPPPPPSGGPAPGASPPTAGLTIARQKLKVVLRKGLAVRATCSSACTLRVQLVVDKATAKKLKLGKKPTVIGTLTRSVGGSTMLKVKLTAKARKALKRARSLKLTVRATAGGAPVTKRVTLKK